MARAALGLLVQLLAMGGGTALSLSSLYSQQLQRNHGAQADAVSQHFQAAAHPATKGILEVAALQLHPFGVDRAKRPQLEMLQQHARVQAHAQAHAEAHQQAMLHQAQWTLISDYTAKFLRNIGIIMCLLLVGVAVHYLLKSTEPKGLRSDGGEKAVYALGAPASGKADAIKEPPAGEAAQAVVAEPAPPLKADAEDAETDVTSATQVAGPPSPPLPRVQPAKIEEPPAKVADDASSSAPPQASGGWLSRRRAARAEGCVQRRGGFMALAGQLALLACGQKNEAQRAREAASARRG